MTTSITVELPIGSASYPRCAADIFTANTLTITALDDDYVMDVYKPGTWRSCVAYDEHGNWVYAFEAPRIALEKAS